MTEGRGTVLIVDTDMGLSLVLADELSPNGIRLIPSSSVKEARSILARFRMVTIDLLVVNCRIPGVGALAMEMSQRHDKLEVIGIVSPNWQCDCCRRLMTFCFRDSKVRDPFWLHRSASLIRNRVLKKRMDADIAGANKPKTPACSVGRLHRR